MNPTAADFLQAIAEAREHSMPGEVSRHVNAIRADRLLCLQWIGERAAELAAARQTDSVEKVIADMRKWNGRLSNQGMQVGAGRVLEWVHRLESLGKAK